MKKKLLAFSIAIICNLTATVLNADDQVSPGLMCRYYDPLGYDDYFDPGGYGANGIRNVDSSSHYVSCPISKDPTAKTRSAWIIINDDSTYCRFYVRTASGGSSSYTPTIVSSGSWYLYLWDFGSSGLDTADDSVAIYCRIDAGKVINYFAHQEL